MKNHFEENGDEFDWRRGNILSFGTGGLINTVNINMVGEVEKA